MTDDKYLSKIAKLLRLAETTDNEQESATYLAKAQELATATSISIAVARAHQADTEKRETPVQKRIQIGERGKQGLKHYVRLALAIAAANDVQCNIARNSSYVIAFGFPSDIAVVEALYASLVLQMVDSSQAYLKSGSYKQETVRAEKYEHVQYSWGRSREYVGMVDKPLDARVARANFQSGFIDRVGSRLLEARDAATETAKAADPVPVEGRTSTGTELVLIAKQVEVSDFYKRTSTARGSWRGGSLSGYSSDARAAGRKAGSTARLGGERAIGGSPRQVTGR